MSVKRTLKRMVTGSRSALQVVQSLSAKKPRVLVYHRFSAPGVSIPHRVSADNFAWQLDILSRDFTVISLAQCVSHYTRSGNWPENAVVLTIDDGYRDMYQWAYPELVKRKMPATFFVTTRFVDGTLWLWPDRLEYALKNTARTSLSLARENFALDAPLHNESDRGAAWQALSDYCISMNNGDMRKFVEQVEALLEVRLPQAPPAEYRASTWSELCEMHAGGIEIGSHTVSHPILSKIESCQLDEEIAGSKREIERQVGAEVRSFCYPNSGLRDINDNVVCSVREAGFSGAVFGTNLRNWERYLIPRMGITNDREDFLWKIYGGESVSLELRGHRVSGPA